VSLPNIPDQTFKFYELCKYMESESIAESVVISFDRNNVDPNTICIVAVALAHNGYMQHYINLLKQSVDKCGNSKEKSNLLVLIGLYYLNLYLKKEKTSENRDVSELSKEYFTQAMAQDTHNPLMWASRALSDICTDREYEKAKQNLVFTEMRSGSSWPDSAILKPMTILISAIANFHNDDFNSASRDFQEVFKLSGHSNPLVRLGIAMCHYKQKRYGEAIKMFERCLSFDNYNTTALIYMCYYLFSSDNNENIVKAYTDIKAACDQYPNNVPFQLLLTHIVFVSKKTAGLKRKFRTIIENIGEKQREYLSEANFQIGRFCHIQKEFDKAKTFYEQAIVFYDKHYLARFALAKFLHEEGEHEKAINNIEPFIKELHDSAEANALLGISYACMYRDTGNNDHQKNALTYMLEAVNISKTSNVVLPESYKLFITLGWVQLKSLQFEKAVKSFLEAVERMKANNLGIDDQTLVFLGISQFQTNDYNGALNSFEQVTNATNPVLRYNMGRCLEMIGKISKAKEIYDSLAKDFPAFAEPFLRLARIYFDLKEYERAEMQYRHLVQDIGIKNVRISIEYGNFFTRLSQFNKSSGYIHSIITDKSINEGKLTAQIYYGTIFLKSAQQNTDIDKKTRYINAAKDAFIKALKLNHYCITAASGLAICWILDDHHNEGIEFLQIVKDNSSNITRSFYNLGYAYMEKKLYQQAASVFEDCNTIHYEKTDIDLLSLVYESFKADGKFEECLVIAQRMISIDSTKPQFWYYLANSIIKTIQINSNKRRIEQHPPRSYTVQKWIAQLNRSISLFEAFNQTNKDENLRNKYQAKIDGYRKKLVPHLVSVKNDALERERNRNKDMLPNMYKPQPGFDRKDY